MSYRHRLFNRYEVTIAKERIPQAAKIIVLSMTIDKASEEIPLSNNTVETMIESLADNIKVQLLGEACTSSSFVPELNEITDVSNVDALCKRLWKLCGFVN